MIELYLASLILAFAVALILTKALIPRLKRFGIIGKDENKPGMPDIPEMGGIAIIAGFSAGMLLAIFFNSFLGFGFNLIFILAAIITIMTVGFIGIVDDMLSIPQWLKAILPLFAAVPLMAVNAAGSTSVTIPFLGMVAFGEIYIFVLLPLAVAVCSNLTNMLAGFNGIEAGMGLIMFLTLSIIAVTHGNTEMALICVSMSGALLAFLAFNVYPAKIFIGDVGTFTIGVALATSVILGNIESAGVILVIPYVLDFFVKAANRFPHTHQELRNGKLYPKDGKVRGLVHVVMKAFNGISERNLVLVFWALEGVFALITLALFLRV